MCVLGINIIIFSYKRREAEICSVSRDTEEEGCAFECKAVPDDPAGFQMTSD